MSENKNTFQVIAEYIQALLGAVFLAILIRGFVFEPFKIPSESMVPSLLVGDHIFVARYKYGLRVPFTKFWLTEFGDPKRGDVVVFTYPEDEDLDFIKRVIGVPGDKVVMKDGILTVNGKLVSYQDFSLNGQSEDNGCVMELTAESGKIVADALQPFPYYAKYKKYTHTVESLPGGANHFVQFSKEDPKNMDFTTTVPERSFFVMGDNRDESHDSRFWGVVRHEYLKGKATYIWLSLSHEHERCAYNFYEPGFFPNVRWDRFGRRIL